jgi:amino acid transporter
VARTLSLRDLVLFYIVAVFNLRWLPVAAAAGPGAIIIWIVACLTLFVPLALCVVELSSRYPEEGGMYVWSRHAFGDFAGFMTGWTYWMSNIPYFPGVLYFAAGNALFVVGAQNTGLAASPAYFIIAAVIGLAIAVLPNVAGMRVGKWVQNAGAIGVWIPALVLIALGMVGAARFGSATTFSLPTSMPELALKDVLFWSTIAFAFGGVETASMMVRSVKAPARTIPRAIAIAGIMIVTLYVLGTVAILVAIPAAEVGGIPGIMQAITRVAGRVGAAGIAPAAAVLITAGAVGAVGAWLTAVSRLPFVAGLEGRLPASFGKLHPRYGTPYVAMLAQAAITVVLIVVGQAGTDIRGAYNIMISMSIIAYFIPFLLMFAAMIRLRREARPEGAPALPGGARAMGGVAAVGFATTLAALVLAFIPAADEANKPLAVAKIVGLTALLLVSGAAIYARSERARRNSAGRGIA